MVAIYDFIFHEKRSQKMQYASGWQSSDVRYDIAIRRV